MIVDIDHDFKNRNGFAILHLVIGNGVLVGIGCAIIKDVENGGNFAATARTAVKRWGYPMNTLIGSDAGTSKDSFVNY